MLAAARARIVRYTPQWRADQQGYSSSLAAASLGELGVDAGDLIGGYDAW